MELSICTDVFAELTYPEMLDKVKSFGIDAVEMTAGGWEPARTVLPGSFWPARKNGLNTWVSLQSGGCGYLP